MAAPGTTGSHKTKSSVIRSFRAQPRDVIRFNDSTDLTINSIIFSKNNDSCNSDFSTM